MGVSNQLRLRDVEDVFQLVQECRELWADAIAWQRHLIAGACRLTGMAVGSYIEQRLTPGGTDNPRVEFLDMSDHGWRDDAARTRFMSMFSDHEDLSQVCPGVKRLAASAQARGDVIAVRPQLIPDRSWYASRIYNDYRRPAYVDGYVLSYVLNRQTGAQIRLAVSQDVGDRPPTPRATAIVSLLNHRIAPLVGTILATRRQNGLHRLPPRLRQTLEWLLAGQSEKQIAAELRISPTTVHEHVGRIYRHFNVETRGELMSYFVNRRPAVSHAS
jgi:DNA-binding CsgD family transcriptional regulator